MKTSAFKEPTQRTLVGLLRERAQQNPDLRAFTFLKDGEVEQDTMTYPELDARAREVAAHLQAAGAAGERALLVYPGSLDYIVAFFGCLYAGVIAVPVYPPRANQHALRLESIIANSRARFVLSNRQLAPKLEEQFASMPLRVMDTTNLEAGATAWHDPDVSEHDIAFLQYTSGSTGDPKGVMLSHSNLLNNSALSARAFGVSEETVGVTWQPLYHDMGLIGCILQPIYVAYQCVMMSPAAFLQRPARWLEAISRYGANISGAPNFAYDLCVRRVSDATRAELDLSRWTVAFSGAEPIRATTMRAFAERFAPCGFKASALYPCYGLAEVTLMASGGVLGQGVVTHEFSSRALEDHRVAPPAADDDLRELVACGEAMTDHDIRIVGTETGRVCPDNEVGEIWIAGPSVAQGYWERTEETQSTFQARLADGRGPYLRTGDLGCMVDGRLYVTGRSKDVIIIRGRNHYPQDIEQTVEVCDEMLRPGCCAAFAIDTPDGEALVVVQELAPRAEPTPALVEKVRSAVAEQHELALDHLVLVKPNQVPRTSSGKIQRRLCRKLYETGELDVVPVAVPEHADVPDNAVEAWLVQRLASWLHVDAKSIDRHRPLSAYRLDSLAAVEMSHAIESELGLSLSFSSLLGSPSIVQLAQLATRSQPIPRLLRNEDLPLSHAQQRMWLAWQIDPHSATYNAFESYAIRGRVDVERLRHSLETLTERHEILRTAFTSIDGVPRQRVLPAGSVDFQASTRPDLADAAALRANVMAEADQPFDLHAGRLLRVRLFELSDESSVLLMVVHHIVADGWSAHVIVREFARLYEQATAGRAAKLPPLTIQYADFAAWQRAQQESRFASDRDYWIEKLAGAETKLALPLDKPRPPVQRPAGDKRVRILPQALINAVDALCQRHDVTLYMALTAAIMTLLRRYSGQDNVLLGSPISGRQRADVQDLVGLFINTLVIRADFPEGLTFAQLLAQLRQTVLEAYDHQDMAFERLVEEMRLERDLSRSPLFQAMFTFHNLRNEALQLDGVTLERLDIDNDTTNFDLSFAMFEVEEGMRCQIKYKTDLFDASTVERMLAHLQTLLESSVVAPDLAVDELPMLLDAERRCLLNDWNDTARAHDGVPVHQAFERRAVEHPDVVALRFEGLELRYAELDARANQLAWHLRHLGLGRENIVAVALERSFELVVSLLAVLKTGAAYLPVDIDLPRERIRYMLSDARPVAMLTLERHLERLSQNDSMMVCLDRDAADIGHCPAQPLDAVVLGKQAAYVIYTSGSTGLPKAVINTHEALSNRIEWMQNAYGLTAHDAVLQKTPFSFDVSVWEFFWPLMQGARLVLARPGGHMDPDYLARLIRQENVSVCHFVPSMLSVFLGAGEAGSCTSLCHVICSGEALPLELKNRFFSKLAAQLHNLYGPTEAAIDVSAWTCEPIQDKVPIGRPISNTQLYVLDRASLPTPIGVAGELHIGGIALARGYLGRAELTAEKFIPDAFSRDPGGRLYRTGDLARFLPDGSIEYLGRIDHQVKIRGLRIELGEIESVLMQQSGVKEAVVLAKAAHGDDRQLVAYIVPAAQSRGSDVVARTETRQLIARLAERLPDYMVPQHFVELEVMPVNSNGKADRKALDALPWQAQLRNETVAPRNFVEQSVQDIWQELMHRDSLGVHDNFFELGGHSLLLTQIASRLRHEFDIDVPLAALFDAPTVADMAQLVVRLQLEQTEDESTGNLLDELSQLSPEEVRRLLESEGLP